MSRIELTDTGMDVIVKMAEGNPGAIQALMEIMSEHDSIDPQALLGPIGAIMSLDTWGIYGTDIYILFSDKCNRNVRRLLMLMRATQMGDFSHVRLQQMAADQRNQLYLSEEEFSELDTKVCAQLDFFKREECSKETIK